MRFLFLLLFFVVVSKTAEFNIDDVIEEKIEHVDPSLNPNPYHLSFSFTSEGSLSTADLGNKVMYNIPSFYVGFEKEFRSFLYQWYGGFGYSAKRTLSAGDDKDKISAYSLNVGIVARRYFFSNDKDGFYPLVGMNHKSAREFHNVTKPDGSKNLQKYRYSFFSSFWGVGYTYPVKALHLKSSIELWRFFKNKDFRNLAIFVKLEIGY